jgi:hypothetical protein
MNQQVCYLFFFGFLFFFFTSRVQVTTGSGLPATSQDKVTGSSFLTTASPVDGTGFTLGGTVALKPKKKVKIK